MFLPRVPINILFCLRFRVGGLGLRVQGLVVHLERVHTSTLHHRTLKGLTGAIVGLIVVIRLPF